MELAPLPVIIMGLICYNPFECRDYEFRLHFTDMVLNEFRLLFEIMIECIPIGIQIPAADCKAVLIQSGDPWIIG
jgi:hypothetical protein